MSRAIAATFWPRGRRALRARRPRGPNVKNVVCEMAAIFVQGRGVNTISQELSSNLITVILC